MLWMVGRGGDVPAWAGGGGHGARCAGADGVREEVGTCCRGLECWGGWRGQLKEWGAGRG